MISSFSSFPLRRNRCAAVLSCGSCGLLDLGVWVGFVRRTIFRCLCFYNDVSPVRLHDVISRALMKVDLFWLMEIDLFQEFHALHSTSTDSGLRVLVPIIIITTITLGQLGTSISPARCMPGGSVRPESCKLRRSWSSPPPHFRARTAVTTVRDGAPLLLMSREVPRSFRFINRPRSTKRTSSHNIRIIKQHCFICSTLSVH